MSDLPTGWEWTILEELTATEPRAMTDGPFGSNLKSSHYVNSGPRVIRLQNIGFGRFIDEKAHIAEQHFEAMRNHEVQAGDLVVASLGQDLPRACLVPPTVGPAIVKADCIRVRLHESIDARFVNYALQRPELRHAVAEQVHGVGRPRLGMIGIKTLPIPLAPHGEQKRIVLAIEEHLSRLDAAQALLVTAESRVSSLARVSSRRLFDSPFWPWTTLGAIAEIKGGVTKDSKRQADPSFVEVPYLRVANVQRGRLDLREVTTIRVPPATSKALRLEPGDVLLNEGGDRDKLGRGWVWEGQIEECIHQNHVFRARLQEEFDPYFVSTHANTWGRAWFEEHGRQTTNLASINLGTLKQLPVPAPPRAEQEAVVVELRKTDDARQRLTTSIEQARKRAASLRRSILAAAFAGQLVPQDSSDEPASVLLERIRVERARAASTRRTRARAVRQ